MASIVYKEDKRGTTGFEDDLARWQLLFDDSQSSMWADPLRTFREAVKCIWSVDMNTLEPHSLRVEDLEYFQNFALGFFDLMAESDDYQTSGMDNQGLLAVQASWRDRLLETSSQATDSNGRHYADPSNYSCCETMGANSVPVTKAGGPILPMPERDKNTLPTRDRLVLVILMAGAIFAAVFAFLLLMRSSPYCIPSHNKCFEVRHNVSSTSVYQDNTGTLRTSLENLVSFSCHHLSTASGIERSRSLLLALLGLDTYGSSATSHHEGERQQKSSQSPGVPITQYKRAASSADSFWHEHQHQHQQHLEPSGQAFESQPDLSQPAKRQKTSKKTFCDECNRDYHTTSNYGKHRAGPLHDNIRHHCSFECGKSFLRKDERAKHERKAHEFLRPQLPLTR